MNKQNTIREQLFETLNRIYDDIDEATKIAGSEESFDEFCDLSFKSYEENIGKNASEEDYPEWPATVFLTNKYLFCYSLFYLILKYEFDIDFINHVMTEEFHHADEAVKRNCCYEFGLRFYKLSDGRLGVEPTTFITEEFDENDEDQRTKFISNVKPIAGIEESSSDWDKKLQDLN